MRLLIGADFGPTKSNMDLFLAGDLQALMGSELVALFQSADFKIFNLELPLTNQKKPIAKNGTHANFMAPTDAVKTYKALGVTALCLANNHIMDQDSQGLASTIETLEHNGISCFGAGKDLLDACRPHIFEFAGGKVGIYACAEHEFSIAGADKAGANPFDPLESLDHVAALKAQCDYVIVLYHGGKEYYRYPSPGLQKTCRKLVEKGADLVLCQHSHCIGCKETYRDGTIVYGQGNFLFDKSNEECWLTGLLVQIDDGYQISYIPVVKNGNTITAASDEQAEQILAAFERRSLEITEDGFVERAYSEFADDRLEFYLGAYVGHRSFVARALNKLSGYRLLKWTIKRRFRKKDLLNFRNMAECEAQRELMLKGCTRYIERMNER